MAKKWIQEAIKPANKGALREELGAKKGKPIPAKKLAEAAKEGGNSRQACASCRNPKENAQEIEDTYETSVYERPYA